MKSSHSKDDLIQKIIKTVNERKPETVNQLVTYLKEQNSLSEDEILKNIIRLKNEGKIKLREYPFHNHLNFFDYMRTNEASWFWLTIIFTTNALVIFLVINENFYPWFYLRNIIGIIFVLWLPGYTFTKAFFPGNKINKVERIPLSFALSLALISIIGLILNFSPWGISLTPIVLSLLSIMLSAAMIGVVREFREKIFK